ncbi:hypothetical protein [Streptomyces spororaveus]|uniref:hypothetical protein n=1 Tax=Streptomyces spororaveus TaxID=284039 RepID=UPI001923B067|nr:hypothetical protein [Streptomyces spororaveus]
MSPGPTSRARTPSPSRPAAASATSRSSAPAAAAPTATPLSVPAEDLAATADRLLPSAPSDTDLATPDLLHHLTATWNMQDEPLRQYAQTLARPVEI